MQKTLSAKIDESVFELVDRIALKKKMSRHIDAGFWAWDREESAEATVQKARQAFNQSMKRHHQ